MEWKKQGRAPEVPGFCTRECSAGRAEAAGTICRRAHCVALLTPACRGGVRVGVWLLLDDDGLECNCGAKSTGLSIARRPYRFHCTMFISVMRLTTARQTFALFVYCELNVQKSYKSLSSSGIWIHSCCYVNASSDLLQFITSTSACKDAWSSRLSHFRLGRRDATTAKRGAAHDEMTTST